LALRSILAHPKCLREVSIESITRIAFQLPFPSVFFHASEQWHPGSEILSTCHPPNWFGTRILSRLLDAVHIAVRGGVSSPTPAPLKNEVFTPFFPQFFSCPAFVDQKKIPSDLHFI
jgi:hypothetical protein